MFAKFESNISGILNFYNRSILPSIMKRKRSSDEGESPNKRTRPEYDPWIAPSNIKNYMINDPILDFLDIQSKPKKHRRFINKISKSTLPETFSDALKYQGKLFEEEVYSLLKARFKDKIVNVKGSLLPEHKYSKFKKTKKLLEKGVPIIYQGVLVDADQKRHGIPDLIVRTDYINKISRTPMHEHDPNQPHYYCIIDIKYSTLQLRADGAHLLSANWANYYKSQLFIYNECLAKLQKYNPNRAYVLGRQWTCTAMGIQYRGNECFDRLGVVDFTEADSHIPEQVKEAEHWIRDLREHHDQWSLTPYLNPSKTRSHDIQTGTYQLPIDELYPNMCNMRDDPHQQTKLKLAHNIGEITTIWMCGPRQRANAHAKGVFSWRDPRCTAELLGFSGKRAQIVNQILTVNRQDKHRMLPRQIKPSGWTDPNRIEFFVDFEALNGVIEDFEQFPVSQESTTVFMINVGYATKSGYKFKQFTAKDLTPDEERRIFTETIEFINHKSKQHKVNNPLLFHWGDYETIQWDRVSALHVLPKLQATWYNLHRVFLEEPIAVRDCFDYSLKSVVPALHSHGLIEHTWDTNLTGKDSTSVALKHYRQGNSREWEEFKTYNQTDCRVLYDIITLLRERAGSQES